uniref:Uncharacterized protein n=1 Tax=Anguilla anguilla TaxID=7936 RepID=A0A0E9RD29_ANGAN
MAYLEQESLFLRVLHVVWCLTREPPLI